MKTPTITPEEIDRYLPQTQCEQCDHPGCLAYARAITRGEADINQCPPGGETTIAHLATLLNRPPKPLNPKHGKPKPLRLALIDETNCIGCRLCIQACPTDCIIGATKLMHTVIQNECTGCELCLPACPTDCITMHPPPPSPSSQPKPNPSLWQDFTQPQITKFRTRAAQKRARTAAQTRARAQKKHLRHRPALQKEILAAIKRKQTTTPQP